mgnify:CR=1 FL=1
MGYIQIKKDIERFYIFYYRGIYEMKWKNGGIWINYEYKKDYQDSSQKGLRVIYSKKIDNECIGNLKKFINFLRRRYYFPIRCNIYIRKVDDFPSLTGIKTTKGIFLFGDEEQKNYLVFMLLAIYLLSGRLRMFTIQLLNY